MLISEFARDTGLPRDTVRFYARLGLLQPKTNGKRAQLRPRCDRGRTFALVIVPCECLAEGSFQIALVHRRTLPGSLALPRRQVGDLPSTMSRNHQTHACLISWPRLRQGTTLTFVSHSLLRRTTPLGRSYNFRSRSAGPLLVCRRAAH